MGKLEAVWQARASLGEGPLWVATEQSVYWVDILTHRVFRYHIHSGEQTTWQFDREITSLAQRAEGGFLATTRDGFAELDLANTSVQEIQYPEAAMPDNRFNDGKVDALGRYWAGSMDDLQQNPTASLYLLDEKLQCTRQDSDYFITNGPSFSPDNSRMYHNDTLKGDIYVFDVSTSGALSNKRLFAHIPEDMGLPDGMTTDVEGCLWVGHFGGWRVSRFSPQGEVVDTIDMPVANVTSCTFAGDDLDTLYITTARAGVDESALPSQPLAGSLFRCKPGVTGLPTPLFKG